MRYLSQAKYLKQKRKIDFLLLILTVIFTLFGLVMVYEASNVSAFQDFADKYYYLKDQLTWTVIGFILLIVAVFIPYKKYFNLAIPLLFLTIFSLGLVLIPGIGLKVLGARRWINLGFITFQPSELAKLSMVLYLAAWLSRKEKGKFFSFIFLLSLIVGLVILQPDLGTAVILTLIFIMVYFISRAPLWHFSVLIPAATLAVVILAVVSPYRYQRLVTFFNPNIDPLGSSYHIRQILISLGSGGLTGLGLGASRQKYQYLPEATTDSIFAIIAEELGFVGASLLVLGFLVLLYRILKIVKNSPDRLSFLLSGGILSLLAAQIIINLGSMVALFPLTGVPLPFISYGGSNLVVSLTAIGIILNISRHTVSDKK